MALKKSTLAGLARVLGAHAGLELPEWVVESRAKERMHERGLGGDDYLALLESPRGAAELAELVEAVRVGETRFFRHQPQVDALLEVVVPSWRARGIARPRVWSAGCASGEEPYTLALVLDKALPPPAFAPSILATDVSAEAIRAAKHATYPAGALDQVPEAYRDGLVRGAHGVRVRPDIASRVTFERQNLATGEVQRAFDLVWCRNVLIYFEPSARREVLRRLVEALAPGGFLFLGYSETLRGVAGLAPLHHGDQVLWQKADAAERHARRASVPPKKASPAERPAAKPARASSPAPSHAARAKATPASAVPAKAAHAKPRPAHAVSEETHHDVKPRSSRRGSVHIAVSDPGALRTDIAKALAHGGLGALTIDLDAAAFLEDDVAPVLRRARAAAEAAGIRVVLRAERPGAKRWLRRNGLEGGGA